MDFLVKIQKYHSDPDKQCQETGLTINIGRNASKFPQVIHAIWIIHLTRLKIIFLLVNRG